MIVAVVDPSRARHDVRAILRGSRFHPNASPRPLDGVLNWLDRVLAPVGRFFQRTFRPVWSAIVSVWSHTIGVLPGPIAIIVVAGAIVAVFVVLGRTISRRSGRESARLQQLPTIREERAADLQRLADRAEADGDFERAVRLRFRAGLQQLDRDAGAIVYRPALTTTEVRRRLHSDRFDGLADTFEAIAYGGAVAVADDVAHARDGWPRVIVEARMQRDGGER